MPRLRNLTGCFMLAALALPIWMAGIAIAENGAPGELPETYTDPDAPWRAAAQWDKVDEEYTIDIHRFTTDPRYISPMVAYLPDGGRVPSPKDVLGYIASAEGKLTHPDDEIRYFEALDKASDRVLLQEMGTTEEGRTMHLVIISDESNLKNLERYKGYTRELSDPRKTDEAAAQKIIRRAKPIMHITAGLHSPETGPPEMVMELAYRLAVSKHPDIEAIRENVILLITPVTEPDGRAQVVDWYYRYLTEYDNPYYMPSRTPPYWGKYTYHDNNRDGIQMTQKLTQNYVAAFHEWHPTYSLDLHESVPLLYVSTGTGPYNEYLDPIVVSEWQLISNWEIGELSKHGMPGVWTWGFYDGWNPSYLLWVTNNHNSLGRFYETFGNSSARTMKRELENQNYAGKPVTSRQWYRHNPPDKKVTWSLRNNNNYMQSGVIASLTLLSREGETFLYNYWKKGKHSLDRGKEKAPYAWVIPAEQSGRDRVAYLINQLRRHEIEVHEATADFKIGEKEYKKGDYVVRLDQPYGDFARMLLSVIMFPKDSEQRPYDDVSWTLGYLYRVKTDKIEDKAIFDVKDIRLVDSEISLAGTVETGVSSVGMIVKNDGSNSLIKSRYRLKDHKVLATSEDTELGGVKYPAGSLVIPAEALLKINSDTLQKIAEECSLSFEMIEGASELKTHELDLPRVALYHNWISTQDDGWARYTLEQMEIDFDYIGDDEIKAGGLRDKYDVIMMANQGGGADAKALIHGRDPKFGPMPYTKTENFTSHGVIDSSNDITGGIGFKGMANLEEFLDKGGTMLLIGSSGRIATDTGLLRNVDSSSGGINTPGAAIQTKVVRRDHPIAYGFEDVNHVFRTNGPVYSVPKHYEHWIVVQYGTKEPPKDDEEEKKVAGEGGEAPAREDAQKEEAPESEGAEKKTEKPGPFLLCGYVSGEDQLQRKGVVLDVPRHKGGRVILYSFNPLHRFLNIGDNNYVWNALMNWNDFPAPEPKEHAGLATD